VVLVEGLTAVLSSQ